MVDASLNQTTYSAVVGRILAMRREQLGLEQVDIARRLGVSQSTWSRLERGETAITVEMLAKVAEALDTAPGHILGEAEQAKNGLAQMGFNVLLNRPQSPGKTALVLLSGAVLGFLIAKVLAK